MNNEEKFKDNNINIVERKSDEKYNNIQQFNKKKLVFENMLLNKKKTNYNQSRKNNISKRFI